MNLLGKFADQRPLMCILGTSTLSALTPLQPILVNTLHVSPVLYSISLSCFLIAYGLGFKLIKDAHIAKILFVLGHLFCFSEDVMVYGIGRLLSGLGAGCMMTHALSPKTLTLAAVTAFLSPLVTTYLLNNNAFLLFHTLAMGGAMSLCVNLRGKLSDQRSFTSENGHMFPCKDVYINAAVWSVYFGALSYLPFLMESSSLLLACMALTSIMTSYFSPYLPITNKHHTLLLMGGCVLTIPFYPVPAMLGMSFSFWVWRRYIQKTYVGQLNMLATLQLYQYVAIAISIPLVFFLCEHKK